MIISERIFSLLQDKGISQKEFSEATGISQSTISDWKRKKTNPASDKIMIICHVLSVDPVTLLSGTESKNFSRPGHIIIEKDSPEYRLVQTYHALDARSRLRLSGYLDALNEDQEDH